MGYTSRIPKITAEAVVKAEAAIELTAQRVAEDARQRVPVDESDLKDSIRVVHRGRAVLAREVRAGRSRGKGAPFYGHLVEWGSAKKPARPFMTPAAESERAEFERLMGETFR